MPFGTSLGQVHESWERVRSYPIHISQVDPIRMFANKPVVETGRQLLIWLFLRCTINDAYVSQVQREWEGGCGCQEVRIVIAN